MEQNNVGAYIKRLVLHGGPSLELEDNSIVVFVGPNNSGKSLSLKEIHALFENGHRITHSIASIEIQKVGDVVALNKLVGNYRDRRSGKFYFSGSQYDSTSQQDLEASWKKADGSVGVISKFLVSHLPTESRITESDPAPSFDATKARYGFSPIHNLFLDWDKEVEIGELFRRYFNVDLVVHRGGGDRIPLYVGDRPQLEGTENATSRSYFDKIEDLDLLHEQGDGIRCFASILLRVWTGISSVVLVDEPEAFLHPPQARAVGELISSGGEFQKQVFIATHSNEVIQGILSKFPSRVSIVRLERYMGSNRATYLPNDKISELWRDPILRYSNALNGLFHNQVVITEADGDCRFYEAVADAVKGDLRSTFYTYAGGKDRIPVIIRALKVLRVPTRCIVDIDVLASDRTLRNIIEAYGFDWSDYKDKVSNTRNVIQSKKSWLLGLGFKERVVGIISGLQDNEIVPREALNKISAAMKETSPWDIIKNAGTAAIPSGDPSRNLHELIDLLKKSNIFIVPVGEMERFCTTVGSHGPQWVAQVLERDIANDPELDSARKFVREVIDFDASAQHVHIEKTPIKERIRRSYKEITYNRMNNFATLAVKGAQFLFFICVGIWLAAQGLSGLLNFLTGKST